MAIPTISGTELRGGAKCKGQHLWSSFLSLMLEPQSCVLEAQQWKANRSLSKSINASWKTPKYRQLSIILQKTSVNMINLIANFNSSIKDYLQMSAYQ